MKRLSTLLFLPVILATGLFASPTHAQRVPSLATAERHVDHERWDKAETALAEIVSAEPENGRAWFLLGYTQAMSGQREKAVVTNRRAADFPAYRSTALYNVACSESLLGRLDDATASLAEARNAGFLDFDLFASDSDLAPLRDRGLIDLPPEHEYEELRARNGIRLAYRVLLPENFDAERTYPALVSFAPGSGGKRCVDWTLEELFTKEARLSGWIIVCIAAPDRGWINHPAHHALEDLLRKLRKELPLEADTFHAFGFREGARVATTYSRMSHKYFSSLTVMANTGWGGWDDKDLEEFRSTPVRQIVGAEDPICLGDARHVQAAFERHKVDGTLVVVEGQGPTLAGLRGSELLSAITDGLRAARPKGDSH